jgi:hypothetical protein
MLMPDGKVGGRTKSIGGRLAAPPSFSRLKELKCFKDVHQRLVDGWPLSEVARYIQQDCKEYTDISKEGLISTLSKYRQTIPALEIAKKELSPVTVQKVEEVHKGLDELKALEDLFRVQLDRIAMDHKLEKQIGKSLNTLGNEIRVAKEIIEASAKLKMELGINDKQLGTLNVDVGGAVVHADVSNPAVKKILDDPQKRTKLLNIAKNLLKNAGNNLSASDIQMAPALPITVAALPAVAKAAIQPDEVIEAELEDESND